MKTDDLLGQLNSLQQMMIDLVQSVPEADCYHSFHARLPPLAWLLGRGAWLETYWIREVLQQDDHMTSRVRHLFSHEARVNESLWRQLPPRDHLLNWALELQDENLTRLANPALLPDHPLLEGNRLLLIILRDHAIVYEQMLAQLNERRLQIESPYRVTAPLCVLPPSEDHTDVHGGHYRIGAKADPAARDNELPTQVVELTGFRIDRLPVSNGVFLGFIEANGYQEPAYWSESGWEWRRHGKTHPHHWRQDDQGAWHGVGLNGPFDLVAEDAVSGLSQHEAVACANWVSSLGGQLKGAVVQHEYQWEVAARGGAISRFGQVWEWCANPFQPYAGYKPPAWAEAATHDFDSGHYVMRGASLHTQRALRRASYRNHAPAEQRFLFTGTRLVFPPSKMPWH